MGRLSSYVNAHQSKTVRRTRLQELEILGALVAQPRALGFLNSVVPSTQRLTISGSALSVRYQKVHCIVSCKPGVIFCLFYGLERCPFQQKLFGTCVSVRFSAIVCLGRCPLWMFHCNDKAYHNLHFSEHNVCIQYIP